MKAVRIGRALNMDFDDASLPLFGTYQPLRAGLLHGHIKDIAVRVCYRLIVGNREHMRRVISLLTLNVPLRVI